MPRTRRSLLALAGTALASLSLAGCIQERDGPGRASPETPLPIDTTTETPTRTPTATRTATDRPTPTETTDSTTETPTETPAETRGGTPPGAPTDYPFWLPAPSAVGQEHYAVTSAAVAAVRDLERHLGDGATDPFHGAYPVPGIAEWAAVDTVHHLDGIARVTTATFDRAAAESAWRSNASEEWSHRGFSLFQTESAVAAVDDGAVVETGTISASRIDDERGAVEAIVDARAGESQRYADANPDCDRLFGAVGPAHVFRARTSAPDDGLPGTVAEAIAYYLAPGESQIHVPVVFEAARVDEAAIREWAADAAVFRDRDVTTVVDGRMVTARVSLPSDEIGQFTGEFPSGQPDRTTTRAPTVSFRFDYEETADGAGVLTITHDSGDAVDAADLYVRGRGFATVEEAVDQTSEGPWQGSVSGDGSVVAGDAVDVGASTNYVIRVVWETADGDAAAVLAEDRGPAT